MTERTRKDNGVTLIELMIVLVIAAILVAGIYTLFMTQQRSYFVQDQVTGVQQDARAALNIMARDIRMAGFVAGAGSATGFTDGSATPLAINGFNYAVNPINFSTVPDTLTVVLGAEELGEVLSVAGTKITLTDDHINPKDVDYYFKNSKGDPINEKYYIAFDLQPGRLYQVTAVDDIDITVSSFPSGSKTVGGKAYGVQAITYLVTTADGVLRRNENTGGGARSLAGDGISTFVEDLQFAYQVGGDAGWYNTTPAGKTNTDIRMVRINITVRTAVQDAIVQDATPTAQFNQPALEDHTTNLKGPDGFRRRVYTTEVKVRNL